MSFLIKTKVCKRADRDIIQIERGTTLAPRTRVKWSGEARAEGWQTFSKSLAHTNNTRARQSKVVQIPISRVVTAAAAAVAVVVRWPAESFRSKNNVPSELGNPGGWGVR